MINQLSGKVIPVEVGGKKGHSQINNAIKKYDSEYGIVITVNESTIFQDGVIRVPLSTFIFC